MSPFLSALPAAFLLEGGGGFNPVDLGNPALLFWQLVVFAILFLLLWAKVWGPLMKTVRARETKIEGDIKAAETARLEAEAVREKHRREMDQAALAVKAMLEEAEARAAKLKSELEAEARVQAEGLVAKARAQILAEKAQALQEIRDQVVDLSVEITRRLLGREVGREDPLKEAEKLMPKVRNLS